MLHQRQSGLQVSRADWNRERFYYGRRSTDDNGEFAIPMPVHAGAEARLVVDHPDYLGPMTLAEIDLINSKVRLPSGAMISGRVLDSEGQPVADAILHFGNCVWADHVPTAKTDKDGNYQMQGFWPGTAALTLQADGHAPQTQTATTFTVPYWAEHRRLGRRTFVPGDQTSSVQLQQHRTMIGKFDLP